MKKILLVEDEKEIRELYALYLTDMGYTVISAEDGNVALQKALVEDWDLMLLDIMLPGQDGIQVLKMIKANERLRDKPVIALTNLNVESVINEIFDLGADGFLVKSEITPDKIVSEVETVLQKYS
ncbi:response regulator [candidate division WWE3 bacterium CG08_land_8_20_14_0_20_41_10]|uniref:Response regulator n=1 Tax=candidate division WWE3 bacterium CG08_land_8_20_14_0_20_41_10 TaxID=1975085 RepID=A0A2H0XCU5_UNCKA|nr:MAG: response regulator [candidate division WWE3 bacterium CG08_land_8_20_14_0_20_41_10]